MNRREFMKVAAASIVAAGVETAGAKELASRIDIDGQSMLQDITVRFLGTGAADWNGRDERGEHRRFSSILIDGHILVDCTKDNPEMIPDNCKPDTIFYTHSHGDHCHPATALKVGVKRVYLSNTWYDIAKLDFQKAAQELGVAMPEIIPIYVGQPVVVGDLKFTPMPASHVTAYVNEQPLIYLIERAGVRLIYATDTGAISAAAAELSGMNSSRREPITAIIIEATMGLGHEDDYRSFTHLSVGAIVSIVKVLEKAKRYAPPAGQPIYLTHMARTLHPTQKELDATLPAPLAAAYDGLEVVFRSK